MASARSANLNKAIVLVILMITMTQVGYLDSMNSLTSSEETLDETNDVLETGGSGSSFAYANDKVAAGYRHTCAILDNGDVKCWGGDYRGQLGNGGTATDLNAPSSTAIDLGTARTAVAVSAAWEHTCAILDNGDLKCWGSDSNGQLGDGGTSHNSNTATVQPSSTPVNLGTGRTAVAVSAGTYHTCAILDNGELKCWGNDNYGQLGDGGSNTDTNAPSSTAIDLGTGRTAVAVSAGTYHTCAILDNGDLKCWGYDYYGQLGDGGSIPVTAPAPSSTAIDLGTGRTAVAVSSSNSHTCAILDNGDLKCWGRDNYGQLGDGGTSSNTNAPSSTPINLGTGRTAVAVGDGVSHTCAILDNGDMKCWGNDANGQLGDGGSNTDQASPVAVSGSNTWDSSTGLSSGSGSATQSNFTASIEGADLIIDEPMTNITFQYNASAANGSGSGSNSGTSNGNGTTWNVVDINSGTGGSYPGQYMEILVGDTLYFSANDGSSGRELWAHDTSNASTWQVANIHSTGSSYPGDKMAILVGDTLYFDADDGSSGYELWAHDTSNASTWQVADIDSGWDSSNPGLFMAILVGDTLYFDAQSGASSGAELWAHDTSNASTWRVADINSGSNPSYPGSNGMEILVGDTLYFSANDGSSGNELWAHDTSNASTWRVADINSGTGNSDPGYYMAILVGDTLYFSANDGSSGAELWGPNIEHSIMY